MRAKRWHSSTETDRDRDRKKMRTETETMMPPVAAPPAAPVMPFPSACVCAYIHAYMHTYIHAYMYICDSGTIHYNRRNVQTFVHYHCTDLLMVTRIHIYLNTLCLCVCLCASVFVSVWYVALSLILYEAFLLTSAFTLQQSSDLVGSFDQVTVSSTPQRASPPVPFFFNVFLFFIVCVRCYITNLSSLFALFLPFFLPASRAPPLLYTRIHTHTHTHTHTIALRTTHDARRTTHYTYHALLFARVN